MMETEQSGFRHNSPKDPWPDLKAGKYDEVIESMSYQRNAWQSKDWRYAANLGLAYMAASIPAKAAETFLLVNELACSDSPRHTGVYYDFIGAALWLSGKREEGADYWVRFIRGIEERTIQFADLSGGVGEGILAYYAGVTLSDQRVLQETKSFFEFAKRNPLASNLPGPLIGYILGRQSLVDVLMASLGNANIEELMLASANDQLLNRQMSQILLCCASVARQAGDAFRAKSDMCLAASLKNSLLEPHWYLAKWECESRP